MSEERWTRCHVGSCKRHQDCMYTPCRAPSVVAEVKGHVAVKDVATPPPPSLHREPTEADREALAQIAATVAGIRAGTMRLNEGLDEIARLAFSTPAASCEAATLERAAMAARDALVAMEWPPQDGDRQIDGVIEAILALKTSA